MNAHGHNSATSYFDNETSGAFYSRELALPRGANNSILKMCATMYLFSDPVTFYSTYIKTCMLVNVVLRKLYLKF